MNANTRELSPSLSITFSATAVIVNGLILSKAASLSNVLLIDTLLRIAALNRVTDVVCSLTLKVTDAWAGQGPIPLHTTVTFSPNCVGTTPRTMLFLIATALLSPSATSKVNSWVRSKRDDDTFLLASPK